MAEPLPDWARDFLTSARVGHLATSSRTAEPHVIPVCFVLLENTIYSVIDEKPKTGSRLKRLRNIDETGKAALVVDRYDEDWARLAYVLVRGRAAVIPAESNVLALLRDKYRQYETMTLANAEMISLSIDHWTAWRAS